MSVENEKEIQQLKNRIRELADKSYNQNQYTFTGFLGLAEQDALWQVEREVKFAGITLYGGREEAERKILRFGSEAELGYEQPFPICCIRIRPLSAKFADKLSHRDYLGALMNLGIERSTIGDILPGEKEAYYKTLGGFLTYLLGYIPKETEKVTYGRFTFEIVDCDNRRIDKVLVTEGTASAKE